jgi:hypothetical protein
LVLIAAIMLRSSDPSDVAFEFLAAKAKPDFYLSASRSSLW